MKAQLCESAHVLRVAPAHGRCRALLGLLGTSTIPWTLKTHVGGSRGERFSDSGLPRGSPRQCGRVNVSVQECHPHGSIAHLFNGSVARTQHEFNRNPSHSHVQLIPELPVSSTDVLPLHPKSLCNCAPQNHISNPGSDMLQPTLGSSAAGKGHWFNVRRLVEGGIQHSMRHSMKAHPS